MGWSKKKRGGEKRRLKEGKPFREVRHCEAVLTAIQGLETFPLPISTLCGRRNRIRMGKATRRGKGRRKIIKEIESRLFKRRLELLEVKQQDLTHHEEGGKGRRWGRL